MTFSIAIQDMRLYRWSVIIVRRLFWTRASTENGRSLEKFVAKATDRFAEQCSYVWEWFLDTCAEAMQCGRSEPQS